MRHVHIDALSRAKKCINNVAGRAVWPLMRIFAYKQHPKNHLAIYSAALASFVTFVARNNLELGALARARAPAIYHRVSLMCLGKSRVAYN